MTSEQLSRLRQGVYRFLGAGFSYPTAEMLEAARGVLPVLEELGLFDFAFAPEVAGAVFELSGADLEALSVAYVAIFEAGVGGAACPPYESAHRSNARTGEVAGLQSELKRTVLRYGLKLEMGSADMVDHVSTEMQVMAMLARTEGQRRASGRPVGRVVANQVEFLNNHLLTWVPGFVGLVQQKDRHPVYTALAGAVASFLGHERQLLPLLAKESEGDE